MGGPTAWHPSSSWPGSGLALLCPTCPFASSCPKPMDRSGHPSTAAPPNGLSLRHTELCLRVCLGRVGNGHAEKRHRQKNPRKINCRQYLIDTASGAGTVIQATRRGGRKAPALGVARYFHRYCPCSPASGHHRGAFERATRAFFCFCRFACSLIMARPRNHPRDAASAGMLLREDGDRAARASLCPDLIQNAGPAAAATRAGPYAQLAPATC